MDFTGEDAFNLWVIATNVLSIAIYWIVGGLYTVLDVTNLPEFVRKYKVQPETNEPVNPKELKKVTR